MKKKRVVVGLSGGVDSSVAAWLLKKQGYEVIGVTMKMWDKERLIPGKDRNGDEIPIPDITEDARRVAGHLGIEFHVLDFQETFREKVMDYFVEEYLSGKTPNPCVACNRGIKWEALLERARTFDAEYIATGHYARIERLENGRYALKRSSTDAKDQTYALYGLSQEQLAHTLMPVGEYTKEEIRNFARKAEIPVAEKKDSQEICFIPDKDYAGFIEKVYGKRMEEGDFVDRDGKILGKHKGLLHYTIGQRKGLNLALGRPVFVGELKTGTNEVVIVENEDLFKTTVYADRVNLMSRENLEKPVRAVAKIRYNHKGSPCILEKDGENRVICRFDEAQRAITPGQSLVFYEGDYVLGGGIITGGR